MSEKNPRFALKLSKKSIIIILSCVAAAVAAAIVIVCCVLFIGGTAKFRVTFDANGGKYENGNTVFVLEGVEENSLIEDPVHPEKEGFGLVGWTLEKDGDVRWDFENDRVTGDITLYAEWSNETFNLGVECDSENGGVNISVVGRHIAGTKITVSATPHPGHIFKNWKIKGEDKVLSTSKDYTFYMPERNIILVAEFGIADEMSNFEFRSTAKSCEITRVDSSVTELIIPDYVTTLSGTALIHAGDTLTSVVIGRGIETIGVYTFSYCRALKSVVIGSGVKTIGDNAFFECTALESVTFSDSVKTIGNQAFYGCESLKSIVIGDGVEEIGEQAFAACASLEKVTFGNSLLRLGRKLFVSSNVLKEIVFTDNYDWFAVNSWEDQSGTKIALSELKKPTKAAEILTSELYVNKFWKSMKMFQQQ